jgi:hypothetical protein
MRRLLLALATILFPSTSSADDKPNVVYLLVDNWGWGDIEIQGSSVPTPRIDAMGQKGSGSRTSTSRISARRPGPLACRSALPRRRPRPGQDLAGYE